MESMMTTTIQAIIDSITDSEKTTMAGKDWFKIDENELSIFHLELLCLLVSAVDFAVYNYFISNQTKKSDFMDIFYEKLDNHYGRVSAEIKTKFYAILDARVAIYGRLIAAHEDFDFRIAEAFLNFIGRKNRIEDIRVIQHIFFHYTKATKEILEKNIM
jgi:hypothetical protein